MNPNYQEKILGLLIWSFAVLCLLVGGASLVKTPAGGGAWLLLGATGGLVGLVAGWLWWRQTAQVQKLWQDVEQWAEGLKEELFASTTPASPPPRIDRSPLAASVQKLLEAIGRLRSRVDQLEQLRTGLEVRVRRLQGEYKQICTILAGLPEPLLAINEYGEVLWTNPSADVLLAHPPKQQAHASLQDLKCPKLAELLQRMRDRRSPGTRTEEIECMDAEGKPHFYRVTLRRLIPETEQPDPTAVSVVATLRDIGDQKALQKRHAEFVSSVSHEMKTPLAGIKAYVELLADGEVEDPETQQEFFQTIAAQVERLQRLVENLLNLARIEAGVVQVRKQAHSLNQILEEAIRVIQPAAEAKQIAMEADLSELYLNVYVDRDLLLQAVINLLSNAVKYTPSGGRVILRSRLEDKYAQFEVEDTGVGLSAEDCQRVFEKFYRVQKDAHMASGTGLGLPLAKHIVEDVHGGTITVESQLGVGSRFRVRLPLLARSWESSLASSEPQESAAAEVAG